MHGDEVVFRITLHKSAQMKEFKKGKNKKKTCHKSTHEVKELKSFLIRVLRKGTYAYKEAKDEPQGGISGIGGRRRDVGGQKGG